MNLLVVDDEVVTTEVLCDKLDRELLRLDKVYAAYNVEMAKQILLTEKIEMILCDVEMPKSNGLELLEWVRGQRYEAEFVFLTCHEKFEYAFGAVQNGAANYLLKPVDIEQVTQALFKVTQKINEKKHLAEIEKYWGYGKRKVIRDFWRNTVLGEMNGRQEEIQEEINRLGLHIDGKRKYALVMLHLKRNAIFKESGSKKLSRFILENILAEALTENIQMENILSWEEDEEYYAVCVSDKRGTDLEKKADTLKKLLGKYYPQALYAGYISRESEIFRLRSVRENMWKYDKSHMLDDGDIHGLEELDRKEGKLEKMLDQKFLLQCLERGERVKLLEYLQKIAAAVKKQDNSLRNMNYFQMDLVQSVNVFLHNHHMDLEFLFSDPAYMEICEKAVTSEFSMIRWITYYINKVLDYVPRKGQNDNLIEFLADYLREHSEENISRNQLAELVHFSPEYVGKLFKKEMGMSIKDYINKVRIDRAKKMLASANHKIIDIALLVGYENMPYFSSVFKKYEGISPAEWKKAYDYSEHWKS